MKILILSFYYYPDLCAGSFRCTALVNELKRLSNYEIEVITTTPNRYFSYRLATPLLEQEDNVVIKRIQIPCHRSGILDQVKAFVCFVRGVKKLTSNGNYELVFATSSRLMTAVLGAWIARKNKSPLYLDIRDLFVDTIKDVFPKKISLFAKPIFSRLENWSFKRALRINLVSQGFREYISRRYPAVELRSFTNGIDPEFISLTNETNRCIPVKRPLVVLYAGNIGEGQGLNLIIPELASTLDGYVHFKIIGDGGRKSLLQEATSNIQNVELLPPVDRIKLIEEYHKADILFLHLNDYDAFHKVLPSKLFEYAATGKPIWAGVSGYSKKFIEEEIANAVVFTPGNIQKAIQVFPTLKMEITNRDAFVEKYKRENIMRAMAKDIVSLL